MAALFRFEIFTPYRLFFAESVEFISIRLSDGEAGVMAYHSPYIAPVETGVLRIKTNKGKWRSAFISSGILEVTEVKTVLMVDAAEWPEEIDTGRAAEAGKQAREDLENALLKFEVDKAKDKIRRSEFRLKVAEMAKTQAGT
jgi:F-type H+-transporting ATPase subunit epsilon